MILFPAIDVLDGKVVRLYQGDYDRSQTYGSDPAEFARRFAEQGATHLHLIDLTGAKTGSQRNFSVLQDIRRAAPHIFIELGGGIRDEESVARSLYAGASRVIIGTAALKNPGFVRRMADSFGERIAVGVDARDGRVATEGWLHTSQVDSIDFCKEMQSIGVKHVIYTDISRDGTEQGIDPELYETLAAIEGLHISASGGVTSLADIAALRDLGLYGTVLGKALYNGRIDLRKAIQTAARLDGAEGEA